jgi:hypothetical protein
MMSVAILGSLEQAGAIDLIGAWAISADGCKNVFVPTGVRFDEAVPFAKIALLFTT